jgi:hypothetical protein
MYVQRMSLRRDTIAHRAKNSNNIASEIFKKARNTRDSLVSTPSLEEKASKSRQKPGKEIQYPGCAKKFIKIRSKENQNRYSNNQKISPTN